MLAPLSIHQWVNGWGWSTIVHITKQGDHTILATQHSKDVPWVGGWKLGHFHPLPRMVCDVLRAPTIHTGIDAPLSSSMCTLGGVGGCMTICHDMWNTINMDGSFGSSFKLATKEMHTYTITTVLEKIILVTMWRILLISFRDSTRLDAISISWMMNPLIL